MIEMIFKPPCLFVAMIIMVFLVAGCSTEQPGRVFVEIGPPPVVSTTKNDDSTSCMYWRCLTTKKLYLQKYAKDSSGTYCSVGAFPLDKGIGAFHLKDIDKHTRDSDVSISMEGDNYAPCPYCPNERMGKCSCDKMHCMPPVEPSGTTATCPWCGKNGNYVPTYGIKGLAGSN